MATITLYMANVFPNNHLERSVYAKVRGQIFDTGVKVESRVWMAYNWRCAQYSTHIPHGQRKELENKVREIWKNPGKHRVVTDKKFMKSLVFVNERIHLTTCHHCGHVV